MNEEVVDSPVATIELTALPKERPSASWVEGVNQNVRPKKDVNAELMALEGELSDEDARATLAEFLYNNPAFMMDVLAGIKMFPMQELLFKGWERCDYSLSVWGRGVSKCIDQNAHVLTQRGMIPIKDVVAGDIIHADQAPQRVLATHLNPEEDGFKVTTKRGYSFTAKRGHKVKVFDLETLDFRFKLIEELDQNEVFPIRRDMACWPAHDPASDYVHERRQAECDLKIVPGEDLYYLMGVILGDGCIRNGRAVKITSADQEVIDFCSACLARILPDSTVSPRHKAGNEAVEIEVSSTGLIRFLEWMGFDHEHYAYQKQFPARVLQAPRQCLSAFLCGLYDTDGFCSVRPASPKKGAVVGYTSSSRDLVEKVQQLLLNFGIVSSISQVHKGGPAVIMGHECMTQDAWSVVITGRYDIGRFLIEVGFKIGRKKRAGIGFVQSLPDTPTVYPIGRYLRRRYKHYHFKSHGLKVFPTMTEDKLFKIRDLDLLDDTDNAKIDAVINEDRYYYDPIESIEPVRTTTVDITVDKEACYWSGGFIHHNSWLVSLFCLYWAIFNPGVRIVVISFAFRASRRILEQCNKFLKDGDAMLLRGSFPKDVQRGTDEWILEVPNGATIRCLPLGDGTKIRGVRADLLVVDEFAFLPEPIIGEILRPFLAANSRIKEQRTIQEREDEMIKAGAMKEEDREVLEDRKKVIFLSSASYQFEHLYRRYSEWIDLLNNPKKIEEMKTSGVSYFISRISHEAAPEGLLNRKEIEEARRDMSEAMFNKEYGAMFISDSSGFFRASKLKACSVPDGESPCLELIGERDASYILGIDVSLSGSETSDHFAMCLLKIVKRKDGKQIGMVVHNYAVAGGNMKDHILYLLFLWKNFNIVYIGVDSSQGDEVEFVNSCNQSKLFKDNHIELLALDADFKRDDHAEVPAQVKRSYNKTIGRIVQKQSFSAVFQRAANEHLQGCLDHAGLLFAGKLAANSGMAGRAMSVDMSMLQNHEEFKDMSPSQFIDNQDFLLDLTRKECAMIQPSTSVLGTMSFDLPQALRRTSGPHRARKDSYSALLLANWCLRVYLEAMTMDVQTGPPEFPYQGA